MRKNIGYTATSYFIFRASSLSLLTSSLATTVKQDMWISILLGFLFGLFPILLFYKVAQKNGHSTIISSGSKLFPKAKYILTIILGIYAFIYTLMILINITTFIKTQYLNKTPLLIISITLLLPVTYLLNQKEKIIPRVSFILSIISILFIIISLLGLTTKINLGNILPLLENNPTKGIIPYISYCTLPIFLLLIFPNDRIKDSLIIGYLLSSITIFIAVFYLVSILGINLIQLFEYPEIQTLKLSFNGILYIRLANFLSLQWILDSFIFITVGIKFTNKAFNIKCNYIVPIILIILNIYLFPNIFIYNKIVQNYFPTLVLFIILPFLLYFWKQKKNNLEEKNFSNNT